MRVIVCNSQLFGTGFGTILVSGLSYGRLGSRLYSLTGGCEDGLSSNIKVRGVVRRVRSTEAVGRLVGIFN